MSLGRAAVLLVLLAATAATVQVAPEAGETLPPVAQMRDTTI